MTVVPATASGRRFADELGTLNQRMAALCDRVVLVVAGQAVPIKPSGSVMEFAPISPPDAGAAAAARARQDTLTKPRGRAGPPRGPVGLGRVVPGPLPAKAIRARPGGGVRR